MNIIQEFDTITAIATPIGTGGVGVIRISGAKSFEIAEKIFTGKNLTAGKISYGWIVDGEVKIDEVIVLPFKNPNSYTGEDVIEIQCHGGVNVVRTILELVLKNGARMAERGEFTKRAFLNKKLDLSQAEAVGDLIHAKSQSFALKSANNLSGLLSAKIGEIKGVIFKVLSRIVAGIDFPDEVEEPSYEYLTENFENAIKDIDEILKYAKSSDILRQGIKVAIVGKPNVGKSSLFNRLLNIERAIVTDVAGTTRDVITETLHMDVAVTLIDTAGIRESSDKVEEIGIEYSKQAVEEADLVLFIYDANSGFNSEDKEIYELVRGKKHLVVANKTDLLQDKNVEGIPVSAYTQDGIEELKNRINDLVASFSVDDIEFVTNQRQQSCLIKCRESLLQALDASKRNELQDLISIDVKQALLYLDEITGEVITDDILNDIFENFCIGK